MADLKIDAKAQFVLWGVIALSVGLYFLGKQIPQETIQKFVEGAGPWGPVVFVFLHMFSIILAPISGLPFLVTGFYLFGATTILLMAVSGMIGFVVNFFIARRWGRSLVTKLVGQDSIHKVDDLAKEYGIIALVFLRFLWSGIADYVSYAYGLTSIKFKTYITISILASIPGWIFWYWLASKSVSIERFLLFTYIITFVGAGTFLFGKFVIFKKKK